MNLVDFCGWLEYFADGINSKHFFNPIEDVKNLIVPTLCIFEVFKSILRQKDENSALNAIALMQQGKIIDLDISISLTAASISLKYKLPMADSIILATAKKHNAIVWTQDVDFKDLENVKYFVKPKP